MRNIPPESVSLAQKIRCEIPIEVKSGKDYSVHSAISKAAENSEYEIETAYILTNYDVETDGKIVYLLVYMSMFITEGADLPVLETIN